MSFCALSSLVTRMVSLEDELQGRSDWSSSSTGECGPSFVWAVSERASLGGGGAAGLAREVINVLV